MATKKRKLEEEIREFINEWTDSCAFVQNSRELSNNKKCNLKRYFQGKHSEFV